MQIGRMCFIYKSNVRHLVLSLMCKNPGHSHPYSKKRLDKWKINNFSWTMRE